MTNMEDIPAFLRRLKGEKPQPWAGRDAPRAPRAPPEDRGPGSVARRLGYPEAPEDAQARAAYLQRAQVEAEAFRVAENARLNALKAERAAEKAEMAAVRQEAKVRNGHKQA